MLTTTATITLTRPRPALAVITLGGELDLAALERLYAIFARASRRPEIVVDLAGVGFIDCAGPRPLVSAPAPRPRPGGVWCCAIPHPPWWP